MGIFWCSVARVFQRNHVVCNEYGVSWTCLSSAPSYGKFWIFGCDADTHYIKKICSSWNEIGAGVAESVSWLGYGMDDRGSIPGSKKHLFSLRHRFYIGSGAYPAFYVMGTRGSFPGSKAAGSWSWPLTFNGQEYVELYLHSPNTPSWRGAQLKRHADFYAEPQ
jgi:hypothetical protein